MWNNYVFSMAFRLYVTCCLLAGTLVITSTAKEPTLSVGFMSSIIKKEQGHYVGAIPDIMRNVTAMTSYELTLKPMPINRLLKALELGEIDAVIGLFKRDKRLVYADYLDMPIGWVCANMFVLASSSQAAVQQVSLRHKQVGMLRGAHWGDKLTSYMADNQVYNVQVSSYDVLAKMLAKGRFDAVIASTDAFVNAAKKQDFEEEYVALPLPYNMDLGMYILLSKKSELVNNSNLRQQLNHAVATLTKNQSIRQIYQQYGKTFYRHCQQ